MKRVALVRLGEARASLEAVPLPKAGGSLLGFFALKRQGVSIDNWTVVSPTDFANLAEDFYEVDGALDPGFPYFDPLGPKAGWRNDNWARGSVNTTFQRESTPLRHDGKLEHRGSGENREWRFEAGYEESLPRYLSGGLIPVLDYAAWVYRQKAFADDASPDSLVRDLRAELNLTDEEFNALFEPPAIEDTTTFFTAEDWPTPAVLELLPRQQAGTAEGPGAEGYDDSYEGEEETELIQPPSDDELIPNILKCLRSEERFEVPDDLIRNFLYSLRSDRVAILAGKPGTGKTEFARAFVHCLRRALAAQHSDIHLVEVAVSEELAEYDMIGYRDLGGHYVPSRVMDDLNRGNPDTDLYVLLLDEMNLAPIDVYGAKLIAGITNRIPVDLPGTCDIAWFPETGRWVPHNGIVVVGTMNSYLEDPSRKMLSIPIKRRANLISMPDPLQELAASDASEGEAPDRFRELCRLLLDQLVTRLRRQGLSILEGRLIDQLVSDVPEEAVRVLWRLTRRLSVHDEIAMTMGLIQSILRFVQTSTFAHVSVALDLQVEQKVLPVVRGPVTILDEVDEALGPGEWRHARTAMDRMRRLAAENAGRIRPLV
jgi:MoxR-like ATPase